MHNLGIQSVPTLYILRFFILFSVIVVPQNDILYFSRHSQMQISDFKLTGVCIESENDIGLRAAEKYNW